MSWRILQGLRPVAQRLTRTTAPGFSSHAAHPTPQAQALWRDILRVATLAGDLDRARIKRMSQPGAAGLLYFMQYMWPLVHPGERLELTPVIEAAAEIAALLPDPDR